jgi:AraC-like DNA-binding protein
VFREKMGVLYSEYLRSLRLKHAVLLMDHGIDSVKNVALLSGFNDPLYFSTVFRKSTGVSPKEYMAKLQDSPSDLPD